MTVEGGAKTTYEYDKNNRLATETKITGDITDITKYQYDNNGNQVYKATETIKPVIEGETESISGFVAGESVDGTNVTFNQYNGFNQLIKTTVGDKTIDYTYNGDGLRTSKTVNDVTTIHIWDGGQIVLELDGAGAVTNKYVRGINLLYAEDGAGTNRKWYLFNGHGDVVQLTGTYGNVTKTYDYDAFGNEKDPDPNDTNVFRYCGEYLDLSSGTYYLRARYYDPATSRMLTEDSYPGDPKDPLSLNLYTYCNNNPINLVDPSGHSGETLAWSGSMWWLCAADGPIPVGDIIYGVGVAGTAVYEYGPAVVNWVGTYGPAAWDATTNFAEQVGDKVSEGTKKAWNWLKEKIGGGSGNQDPNKWNKKVPDIKYEISKVAEDWQTKGFHLKIDGVEVAMKPGQNGTIVFKQVFSSTSSKAAQSAIDKAYQLLQDPSIRQQFYQKAINARDYMSTFGTEAATSKAGELNFLVKALEKLGVN